MTWPSSADELVRVQEELARADPPPWRPSGPLVVGGCFACFARGPSGPGAAGDSAWAGAALVERGAVVAEAVVTGKAAAPYEPGLLALREGPLLEGAVRALPRPPDLLFVDATGRDHPRRAGLALHLGAMLGVPTVGVTHRPLLARGDWPRDSAGEREPLFLDGELVAWWVRTRRGTRPLVAHAAWRTDAETAAKLLFAAARGLRTPEPLRAARRVARTARAD